MDRERNATMTGTTIADTLDTEEQIEEAKASLDRKDH